MSSDDHEREPLAPVLVVSAAVLLASSTWFSGTAAVPALRAAWRLTDTGSALLTTSVQLGFITGTFLYSMLNLADRFNARRVFLVSALLGAAANGAFAALATSLAPALALRFATGVTLAGVYPVGMKIVASWYRTGLGWRLGVMVGALTLGTAAPYFFAVLGADFDWRALVGAASVAATAGGILMAAAVGDGPHLRRRAPFDPKMLFKVFSHRPFRLTAIGYFGHMWELYAFWALIAFYLTERFGGTGWADAVPLLSFAAIATGAVGCVAGGWVSRRFGERNVALASLLVSGACCALSGIAFALPAPLLVAFLLIWGFFVVSDSPQFSALAARHAPPDYTGTALTIQNGIGFAITTLSIQLLPLLAPHLTWRHAFLPLLAGPAAGALATRLLEPAPHR